MWNELKKEFIYMSEFDTFASNGFLFHVGLNKKLSLLFI